MGINLIWAQDNQGAIGKENDLPWHLSEDLKFFKAKTADAVVLMGRKTWVSLPFKPLPRRTNVVLSHTSQTIEGAEVVTSVEEALQKYPDMWVIGGSEIYRLFLPYADDVFITRVDTVVVHADAFAPVDLGGLVVLNYSERKYDAKAGLWYRFEHLTRLKENE